LVIGEQQCFVWDISKHKMTAYAKNLWWPWPPTPPVYPMVDV